MTREQVLDQCYSARTAEEVAAAWQARSAYLDRHPDDWEVLEVGAMLSRREQVLQDASRDQTRVPAITSERNG